MFLNDFKKMTKNRIAEKKFLDAQNSVAVLKTGKTNKHIEIPLYNVLDH